MRVKILGGPLDGEVYEVIDGSRVITLAQLLDDPREMWKEGEEARRVNFRTVCLPIHNGTAVWKEP